MKNDSISGIYETLSDCASISKWAGGIGLHIHNIRASGSHIRGTNGTSNGIVPMLRVFNNTARYVDQGGGKRNGSFAIYLEPWHKDIREFLDMKKNHGDEEQRARDLFYALWIPDLFMKRVAAGEKWTLMCPDECKGLSDVYGDEFSAKYQDYAQDYCEGSSLENSDLEVIVYNSKIAGINLVNSHSNSKNEIYEFVKNFISDPGSETKNNNWTGYKNLSIGDLLIFYGNTKIANETIEYLEITSPEMLDFTVGERVMNATG